MEQRLTPLIKKDYLHISDMNGVIQDVDLPVPDPEQIWITPNIKATSMGSVLRLYGKSAKDHH